MFIIQTVVIQNTLTTSFIYGLLIYQKLTDKFSNSYTVASVCHLAEKSNIILL